ncbi:MAG: BamA/TamA family outer membrane protein [candidate division KSB1 bacterium]|nr:BamA/TamA family outer membrane protein [candidate division KSB1 bacterium]
MKKRVLLLCIFSCALSVWGQNQDSEDIVKTGWNVGLLPAIAYNSDLGFEYGAIVNLFNYGDGSNYPNYDHSLYLEVSRFTKGSGIFRAYYDTQYLIPNIRLTADLSYLPDEAYDFFGFNGYESVYHPDWEDDTSDDYKSRMVYKYQRNLFRAKADFQGGISGENFRWIAGAAVRNFDIAPVDIEKLNKGLDKEDKLPSVDEQPGLYEKYLNWGLIPEDEKNGGTIASVKAGLVYDTRNTVQNPSKGLWTEAVLVGSPSFLSDESFIKFSLTHRQYHSITKSLTFAGRFGYQTTLSGHSPFYFQPLMITSVYTGAWNEGLGGQRSIRGVNRNRIVGDGFVYGNFELRWIVWRFNIGNQNFYLGLNSFFDTGRVTDEINISPAQSDEQSDPYFDPGSESLHHSAGLGLKIAMNWNFVLSVEYGQAFDEQDGDSGLYIALNYLF